MSQSTTWRHAELYLFDTCTQKCGYCWLAESGAVLDSEQLAPYKDPEFIPAVARFFNERTSQQQRWTLSLTGGEPLLAPNLDQLCDALIGAGNRVAFYTSLLVGDAHPGFQYLLSRSAPEIHYLMISYHPESERFQDRFFAKVSRLRDCGHQVILRFVGHPKRLDLLPELAQRCQSLDIPFYPTTLLSDSFPRAYREEERTLLASYFSTRSQWIQLEGGIDTTSSLCHAGSRMISVDLRSGAVTPCITVKSPILGNIFDNTLQLDSAPRPCPEAGVNCICDIHFQEDTVVGAEDSELFARVLKGVSQPGDCSSPIAGLQASGIDFYPSEVTGIGKVRNIDQLIFTGDEVRRAFHSSREQSGLQKSQWAASTAPAPEPQELLAEASALAHSEPLRHRLEWSFSAGFDAPDPTTSRRRDIWKAARKSSIDEPLVFPWIEGLQLALQLGDDLSRQLFVTGCVDPNELMLLSSILKPDEVVMDLGANAGIYSLFAARRVGPTGRVIAVEPSSRDRARLQENIQRNELNITVRPEALGEQAGSVALNIAGPRHEGQNTLGRFVHSGVVALGPETVPMISLDALGEELGLERLDFVKIDVEGAEGRILTGGAALLRRFRPVILLEWLDSALRLQGSSTDALRVQLKELGYELYGFARCGRLEPLSEQFDDGNVVAWPKGRAIPLRVLAAPETFGAGLAIERCRATHPKALKEALELRQELASRDQLSEAQWTQLIAALVDRKPGLILELGDGLGARSCLALEAAAILDCRVLSLARAGERKAFAEEVEGLRGEAWLSRLDAREDPIAELDFAELLRNVGQVTVIWSVGGFDAAEVILGRLGPQLLSRDHRVIVTGLTDARFHDVRGYGGRGLWRGGNDASRVLIGEIDAGVPQAVAALDFTGRNSLKLHSADEELREALGGKAWAESLLDGHWFHFSLNEREHGSEPPTFPSVKVIEPEPEPEPKPEPEPGLFGRLRRAAGAVIRPLDPEQN